jgi:uroporphyrinogen decarboxylase
VIEMNKRERIKATLAGAPVDRPAVSFWRHIYREETSAESLAAAMLGFQKKYDWDFMKVNPRAEYHAEAWGNLYAYSDNDYKKHEFKEACIEDKDDWTKLAILPPHQGVLGEHLEALRVIADDIDSDVIFVMTVFTPLSIALRLVNDAGKLVQWINEAPSQLHHGLEVIAETFANFSRACLDAGAGGVFFATTDCASSDLLSPEQYDVFGRTYDLMVLDAVSDAEFNILHVCKSNNLLHHLLDYPVHAVNWDATDQTNPTLRDIAKRTDKTIIGGVNHTKHLLAGSPKMILSDAHDACNETGGKKWMLGGGCTFSPQVSESNLMALRYAFDPAAPT